MLKSTWPKFEIFRAIYSRVLEKSLFSNKGTRINHLRNLDDAIMGIGFPSAMASYKFTSWSKSVT
jgi:hypothetical protein